MSGQGGGKADVVVIGGGIVGLATAYYLARRNVRVVLLEKGRLGGEQSSRNWGFVRQQGRDPAETPMMALSNGIWSGLEAELDTDIEWSQGGNLALARDEETLERYTQAQHIAEDAGIPTRLLGREGVQALLPQLRGPFIGGLYCESDGQADPLKATLAFAKGARRHGAELREYCAVERILTQGGRVCGVATAQGDVQAQTVVCAAGPHASFLARTVGLSLPVRAVRSTVAATRPMAPLTRLAVWGFGVGFRQARDGRFILGKASAGTADYDVTLDSLRHLRTFLPIYLKNRELFNLRVGKPLVLDLLRHLPGTRARRHPFRHLVDVEPPANPATGRSSLAAFRAHLPELGEVAIERIWAGIIDATPDLLPVLGGVRALPGLVLATGFSGHGFGLGPGAARLVSELIVDGKPSLEIRALRYERFAERDFGLPRKIL